LNSDKIEPIQSDSKFKSYFCPHCQRLLMRGHVRHLKMNCPHCQKLVDADEDELAGRNVFIEELDCVDGLGRIAKKFKDDR